MTGVLDIGIRVSKMGKRDEADEATRTIKQQDKAARELIASKGKRVGKVFKYLDESGFTVLAQVTADVIPRVERGESDGVVFGYSDRVARNWWELGAFFTAADNAVAEVWDATMPDVDYRSDEGRTLWGVKAVVNEIPSLNAKRKSRDLADDLVALGVPNMVSYGYRRNKHVVVDANGEERIVKTDAERQDKALVPDEVQAPILRRIFAMRDDGVGYGKMIDTFALEGIVGPKGGAWTHAGLAKMIRSEVYLGVVKLGKRRNESAHEPLVSRTLWNRVQSTTKITRTGNYVAGLAGGLVRCPGCQQVMSIAGNGRRVDGSIISTYGCRRYTAKGRCDSPAYVLKETADTFVEDLIVTLLDSGDGLQILASARELAEARDAWALAKERREQFVDMVDTLEAADFRRGYAQRQDLEKAAHARYQDLCARAGDAEEFPKDSSAWRLYDDEHQRLVVRRLIDRIIVHPPASRRRDTPSEDRFEVTLVDGTKFARGEWEVAA